ncbi:Bromodomain-containing protein, partial [Chytridium lagenaria]
STLFKALPSKSLYPDYYEFIENPICLNQIQGKIVSGKYISPGELRKDIVLLFSNAREYNVSGSQVFIDAEYMMVRS